jgi:hypothetical protein
MVSGGDPSVGEARSTIFEKFRKTDTKGLQWWRQTDILLLLWVICPNDP